MDYKTTKDEAKYKVTGNKLKNTKQYRRVSEYKVNKGP